jgi:hypothetical protein
MRLLTGIRLTTVALLCAALVGSVLVRDGVGASQCALPGERVVRRSAQLVIVARERFHRDKGPAHYACLRSGRHRTRLDRNGEATVVYPPAGVWAAILLQKEVGRLAGVLVIRLTNVRTGLHYETGGAGGPCCDILAVRLEPTGTVAFLIRNSIGEDRLYACPMPSCYPHSRKVIEPERVDEAMHIPVNSVSLRHGILRWIADGVAHVLDLHA